MFRDPKDAPKPTTINVLISDGGMGDLICYLVPTKYLIENYSSYITPLIWVPDYLLDFAKHVLPKGVSIRNYTEAKTKYNDKLFGISTQWNRHTAMRTHPVDFSFHLLMDESPPDSKRNYLKINPDKINIQKFKLPEKYVVVTVTATDDVKTMPPKTINEISEYVISKGYTPVFVGKSASSLGYEDMIVRAKPADVKYELGINLVDKTTVLETAAIIHGAKVYIGMDGGVTHLAGCTDTPIVVGYTFIDPRHNLPIRNNERGWNCYTVTPDEKELKCTFCQTKMNLVFNHNFRNCYYKDNLCTTYMTSDKFIIHLEKLL